MHFQKKLWYLLVYCRLQYIDIFLFQNFGGGAKAPVATPPGYAPEVCCLLALNITDPYLELILHLLPVNVQVISKEIFIFADIT